jgi:DNA-binding response OmpR family regulator
MGRVLCIDDEPGVRTLVRKVLEQDGHHVSTAADGIGGLQSACSDDWDLVVLDLMLPDLPGMAVLGAMLDRKSDQRVLVLSSRNDMTSRVTCLERGAVDYVGKPFAVRELRARVRARIADAPRSAASHVTAAGLQLHPARRQLTIDDRTVDLSPREFLLIKQLMSDPEAVHSREELLREVWGYAFDPGSNVVEVAVARLRQKTGDALIKTVRNVGYTLSA